ncbi:HAD-like domain-containing protein [Penicillium longicatenatum]|uniref:HAD-like domain-containing protein n=1 Tax=Penicillium longicatenatum TaxID=1561947 RepID=UPI002546FDF7|nr:HAD-like domain-containing protein [Penicillium longicatenatum]KAJ5650203.1 HAD-like domain-containing protein [Penicillium longicatenatum]
MSDKIIIAFDMYGTLLSTDSIVKQLDTHVGSTQASSISTLWRRYQLEYTWRLNSMHQYEDFSTVTRNSLRQALAEHDQQLPESGIDTLLEAYDSLHTFPDVGPALNRIANDPNLQAVIFSNGTKNMISNSVLHSPDLSQHANVFQDLVTVDDARVYKPAPASYQHCARTIGKQPSQMNEIWLISCNAWDIVGARNAGLNAIWIDRAGKGWQDAAVPELKPTAIVRSLEQIIKEIKSRQT